jgi:glycosyltransferase involved in cell wall biosynthesis
LWVHKNHSTLLKGFALLKQKLPELQMVCAGVHTDEAFARNPAYGRWSLAKDLRARAIELHLEPGRDVIGLGTVSDPVLGALYESAFCFIAASTYEGGSLPMLEAVARGCPVACSDIPVFRDIATFYGIRPFYFPPTDPAALAFAVQQLVSQPIPAPVLETMAARIRQRTWRDAAQEYLQVMRTVLAPAQPNSGLGALQPTSL